MCKRQMLGELSGYWCDGRFLSNVMAEAALVSCICVTRNRVALLSRAVHSFLQQTYSPCELIILYEADDIETRSYVRTLSESRIVPMEVQAMPCLSLGSLRNIAVRDARGQYIAQWDDDDWSAPTRLAEQMQAIRTSSRSGCVLLRWTLYDSLTRRAMLSSQRLWEGSLVAERLAVPTFAELEKGEVATAVVHMFNASQLVGLDRPELYVFVYHGANMWDRLHWDTVITAGAAALSPEVSLGIERQLQFPSPI